MPGESVTLTTRSVRASSRRELTEPAVFACANATAKTHGGIATYLPLTRCYSGAPFTKAAVGVSIRMISCEFPGSAETRHAVTDPGAGGHPNLYVTPLTTTASVPSASGPQLKSPDATWSGIRWDAEANTAVSPVKTLELYI